MWNSLVTNAICSKGNGQSYWDERKDTDLVREYGIDGTTLSQGKESRKT